MKARWWISNRLLATERKREPAEFIFKALIIACKFMPRKIISPKQIYMPHLRGRGEMFVHVSPRAAGSKVYLCLVMFTHSVKQMIYKYHFKILRSNCE